MLLLQAQHVAQHFGADILFEDINMDIQDHSRIGLVGRNGAGKSTLIKMIMGLKEPSEGKITKKKNLSIGYLAQSNGLESNQSIYLEMKSVFKSLIEMEEKIHKLETQIASPNVDSDSPQYQQLLNQYDQLSHDFKELNGYGYENEIKGVLKGLGFNDSDFDRPVNSLSGGQKTRLALAKLLLEKRDLLILDEPTNHLDIQTLTWLENYIQNYSGALLIVSHDRYFLDKVVNEIYEITHKHSNHYTGNYSDYIKEKQARLKAQWKAYEKQQNEINHLEEFVNKNIVRASTTKRAQSKRKQLEKIDRLDRPEGYEKGPHFEFTSDKDSGNVVLQVNDAAIGYDQKILSEPINLEIKKHQIIAIVGPNGIGKSTLLKSILNKIPLIKGKIRLGSNVQPGYYDQEQQTLHSNKTVLNEIWDDHPTTPEKDIRSILGSFLFQGDEVKKIVHNLSGGEKARLMLTKLAMQHDNFLILDEPTNHLDIESKEVLEQAIQNFNGTVLFVSHDRYFINKVASEVLEITPDGSTLYLGNYDYYVTKKEEQEFLKSSKNENKIQESQISNAKLNYQQSKEQQKKLRKLNRELQKIEEMISNSEIQKEKVEHEMTQPDAFNDINKMNDLQMKLDKISKELDNLEQEWEEKSIELEEFQDNLG
ncbi:ABC-F family ATP-binding cassette domain-containing protein [Ligilactobacillus cholophilus]|uniref:ABC-F family ATP-binding cassette domain-containing protein n=1 Tax=Ligilactobacillus cholophilus TaxID=3050131 RepID=UPI0025B16D99|nr:ABC-F family ATP-binding cassette domain-containing protein [Ligilactobacillus cholophilus]